MERIKKQINDLLGETILISSGGKTDKKKYDTIKGVINMIFKQIEDESKPKDEKSIFINKLLNETNLKEIVSTEGSKSAAANTKITDLEINADILKTLFEDFKAKNIDISQYKIEPFDRRTKDTISSNMINFQKKYKHETPFVSVSLKGLINDSNGMVTIDKRTESKISSTPKQKGGTNWAITIEIKMVKNDAPLKATLPAKLEPILPPPIPATRLVEAAPSVHAAVLADAAPGSTAAPPSLSGIPPPSTSSTAALPAAKSSDPPGGPMDFTLENLMKGFYYQNK